jgi:PAS domain S-box-containing protein
VTTGRKTLAGSVLALSILLGAGLLAYQSMLDLMERRHWVEHTHQVLETIEVVVALIVDTETAARGYMITGKEEYLQPRDAADEPLAQRLLSLRELTADNPSQQRHLDKLERLVRAQLGSLDRLVSARTAHGIGAVSDPSLLVPGKKYMDDIRSLTGAMKDQERTLLAQREAQANAHARQTMVVLLGGTLVSVALLAAVLYLLYGEIRQRTRAEHVLRESEGRFRAILDNAAALIYLKDPSGRLLFINRRCEEVFRIPRNQALGKTYHDFFPGEVADAYSANDMKVLSSGQPLEIEEPAVHDDGIHTYVSVKFPLMDSWGVPSAVCGISTDITPQKRLAEALRETDQRLNLALSSAGVGTWSLNIVDDAIIWDDHIHQLFGLVPGTFGGKLEDAMRMLHPDDRERVAREVANAVELDAPYDTEHRVVWPDGSIHVLGARGKVYRADDGRALRMTGVCWDTTERKRAEERLHERTLQLEAANEALGSFTYSVSHDLRAPLRAIDGYARILLEDHADRLDAEGERVLGVVCTNARQMGKLIDDLLTFSRLGRGDLEKSRVDMTALAQSAVEELRRLEPERRVAVTIAPLAPALADGTLIRQVLTNLIGNAWKFTRTRAEATIEIGCTPSAGELTYFVRDNGAGFEMEYANKLFGVFQRLHRAEEFEGTGVGLAIVQRIVQRHGGRVWAEGAVDHGATFYFTLPEGGLRHGAQGSGDTARRGQPGGRRARPEGAAEA